MQTRGRRVNRWLAAVAAALIALGSTFVIVGTASASAPVGHRPVIKFWPNYNVVTMTVPLRVWCPKSKPFCEWQLYVNEPDIPSQKLVGTATGTSGILTVNYPKHFCGVIQADALVGPAPWLFQFGHKRTIQYRAQLRCEHHHDHQAAPHHHDHRGQHHHHDDQAAPHHHDHQASDHDDQGAAHTDHRDPDLRAPVHVHLGRRGGGGGERIDHVHGGRRPVAVHRRRHTTGRLCRRGPDHARLLHSDDARAAATSNAADGLFDADELGRGNGHPHHPMVPGRLSRGRCHSSGAAG